MQRFHPQKDQGQNHQVEEGHKKEGKKIPQ
jgi:hypothetical protein